MKAVCEAVWCFDLSDRRKSIKMYETHIHDSNKITRVLFSPLRQNSDESNIQFEETLGISKIQYLRVHVDLLQRLQQNSDERFDYQRTALGCTNGLVEAQAAEYK